MQEATDVQLSCPRPKSNYAQVLLAHGGGGKLTNQLISRLFVPAFRNTALDELHDGAVLQVGSARIAFSTDSYVVHPLFFPGGDIGKLAVNGTANDLAMCGARPLYLSAGMIIEEGLPMETLERVVASMQEAADESGVQLVTGDTKVVDKGKGDGMFINTSGIGIIEHDLVISPRSVKPGDLILINGDIARHGIAIMAVREGLAFESEIESDSASLCGLVMQMLEAGIEIHCMRDLTRGGLASATVEIAESSASHIVLNERAIAVREDVQGACEMLGLDPLYVANEGRFIAIVAPGDAERALSIMRAHPLGSEAAVIGELTASPAGLVTMKTRIGSSRVVDTLSGEQLPRIC